MKLESQILPQTSRHYSLLGLMYSHQYRQMQDLPPAGFHGMGSLQQQALVSHIEDFCDCV